MDGVYGIEIGSVEEGEWERDGAPVLRRDIEVEERSYRGRRVRVAISAWASAEWKDRR